jgi:transcriptional regulator with XRE-family HTH domain
MGTRRRRDVPEQIPTPLGLALIWLRSAAAWTQTRLAQALGLPKESISQYERGTKSLTRERLDFLVEPLAPPEAVDVLLFAHGLIFPEPGKEAPSPVALTPEERRRIDRAVMAAGWTAGRIAAESLRIELSRRKKREKMEAARLEAQELWARLKAVTRQDRRDMVAALPELWSWALAQRVSHESERMAAHKVEEALELADLALAIAERVPGEKSWRSRVEGYCWAHVANARRVANNLSGADEAFARAWDLWRAGAESDPDLLAEWRLFDLEASLRRDERHFSESLKLLDLARAACGGDPLATGRILLKREHVFEQMGDIQNAVATQAEAAPFIEVSGDTRHIFLFRFKSANHLCHLERYEEAAKLLPQVREMAVQQANELDLIRLVWLESKVAAGQGRKQEAIVGLEQVGRDFTGRELPYDAALSSLDLSVLWLNVGRTAKVRELAVTMSWIFKAKRIDREALAALRLFCDAARQESATVELARRVIADIEQARRSAPPFCEGRGRD